MAHIRSKQAKPPPCYAGVTDERGKWNGVVEALPAALEVPLRVRKPTTFAVWNDLLHESIPFSFVDKALSMMALTPQHRYLVLTKRPERMREYFASHQKPEAEFAGEANAEWMLSVLGWDKWSAAVDTVSDYFRSLGSARPNLWLGASASTQPELDRVAKDLQATPAAIRFLSLEPLIEEMRLLWHDDDSGLLDGPIMERRGGKCGHAPGEPDEWWEDSDSFIDWVIVGAESGHNRRECKDEWIESIVEQCREAGVSCFVKQNHRDGKVVKSPSEFPQEMPEQ